MKRRSAVYPTDVRESCPPPSMGMGPPSMGMGPPSHGALLLLLLLLGAAGEWYDPRDDQLCSLAVEFSCQDGQPAYSVCRDNPCNGIHVDGDNVEHACGTDEHGCPLRARSWADDLKSCDDVCARAGASCARAAHMNADPCASEAHEESELTCGQDIRDAGLTDPARAVLVRAGVHDHRGLLRRVAGPLGPRPGQVPGALVRTPRRGLLRRRPLNVVRGRIHARARQRRRRLLAGQAWVPLPSARRDARADV